MKWMMMVLLGLLAIASPALAIETSEHHYYRTMLVEETGSVIAYRGTLDLRFVGHGTINGYYRAAAGTDLPVPVIGGIDGKNIWLDISDNGRLHVVGTTDNTGAVLGRAWYDGTNVFYIFRAKPTDAADSGARRTGFFIASQRRFAPGVR